MCSLENVTNAAIHQIDRDDSPLIRCSQYKVPRRLDSEENKEIDKMLELGIICPSNNPWASLCADYRKLNSVTKKDAYPIPSMERMIAKVASAKFITTLDLTKGYWQVSLEKTTIEKSAFITSKGLYEFLVMAFGMKTASATFQRMMSDVVLKGLHFADAYPGDVEVDTPTFEQHLLERGRVVRTSDLKSVGRGFKSRSDRQLMLFSEAPSSTSRLRL